MIDDLLDRVWRKGYTCNEFACEAWKKITGKDLSKKLYSHLVNEDKFSKLDGPQNPCLVFMSNNDKTDTHIGIFYNGKILHLTMRGVQLAPLELIKLYFKDVRFYQ